VNFVADPGHSYINENGENGAVRILGQFSLAAGGMGQYNRRNWGGEAMLSYEKTGLVIWGLTEIGGWHFASRFSYYQRCEGRVVSYIERMMGFYRVHVTWRGRLGYCDIEYRAEKFDDALQQAQKFLDMYNKATEQEELWKDYWSPHNIKGYWQTKYYKGEK
jgi:hypothetical protein